MQRADRGMRSVQEAADREQRAEDSPYGGRESQVGAGRWEMVGDRRERRAESREQRAEIREHRAESTMAEKIAESRAGNAVLRDVAGWMQQYIPYVFAQVRRAMNSDGASSRSRNGRE